jgi:5-methylcytosine-specific restriction endonuclease McrA
MVAVLLLNASYEPLAVIPRRRALSLILRDRVDAVTEDILLMRSVRRALPVPTVIRLRRYVNVPRRGARWSRQGVLRRDGYTCIYCGIGAGDEQRGLVVTKRDFTIDHIVPRSRNGRNTWGNTACACPACNQRKGNRTLQAAGMALRWEPKIPRVDYLVASSEIPEAWKIYLRV